MDIADVPRVVVAGDHDQVPGLDPVDELARHLVLALVAIGGEVAADHDDIGAKLADLLDRALEEIGLEMW